MSDFVQPQSEPESSSAIPHHPAPESALALQPNQPPSDAVPQLPSPATEEKLINPYQLASDSPDYAPPDAPPYPIPPVSPETLQNATHCYSPATRDPSAPEADRPWKPRHGPDIPALRARFKPLSQHQLKAIDLLIAGHTDADVASEVGVHRVTVTRWRLYHLIFQAEFNRRRQEVFASAAERFRCGLHRAVRTLVRQLKDENALVAFRAARTMLLLASRFAPPDDPADPHAIVDLHARTKRIEWNSMDPRFDHIDDDDRARALADLVWLNENHSFDPPDAAH